MDKRPSCTGTFTFLWIHTLREEPLHHFLFLLTQRSIPLSSIYIDNHGNPSEMDKEFQIPDHVLGWGLYGATPFVASCDPTAKATVLRQDLPSPIAPVAEVPVLTNGTPSGRTCRGTDGNMIPDSMWSSALASSQFRNLR
jgi:hypothetical protein